MIFNGIISKLILGTVQFGIPYGVTNKSGRIVDDWGLSEILNFAHVSGIETLDTARDYGNAIERLGEHQADSHRFKFISKFKASTLNADLKSCVKEDLATLKINYFDSFLFHSFDDILKEGLVADVAVLKEEGFIRRIGVSVYGNDEFNKAIDSEYIELIQLPFNLLDNENQRGELIEKAKKAGKEIHIRSAFLQGLFFMDIDYVPAKLTPIKPYIKELQTISDELNVSIAEMAIMYPLLNELIDGVLIGVDNVDQLKKNISAITNSELDKRFVERINKIKVPAELTPLLNPVNWK